MMIQTKTRTVTRITDTIEDSSVIHHAAIQANKRGLEGYRLINSAFGPGATAVDLTFEKVDPEGAQ